MYLKFDEIEIFSLLGAIRDARRSAIFYYEDYKDKEDRIGITSPEEWEELYNSIIKQLHEHEKFEFLKPIKTRQNTLLKA